MRKYAAALICLFLGCAAGSTMPTITAQSFGANPSAPRWEQFCETHANLHREDNLAGLNGAVRRYGAEGWELATASTIGPTSGIYCFKRPVAQ